MLLAKSQGNPTVLHSCHSSSISVAGEGSWHPPITGDPPPSSDLPLNRGSRQRSMPQSKRVTIPCPLHHPVLASSLFSPLLSSPYPSLHPSSRSPACSSIQAPNRIRRDGRLEIRKLSIHHPRGGGGAEGCTEGRQGARKEKSKVA
ncbi:hypothetical protein Q7C36_018934 [Tachysurus vachellii]|uniref:Uncharacterized protein n=1 Tax=Tachysurus vachellii TaxID=175792 RepID=A0AA88LX20_TACVA|nr:hypothetical protein Q7C36_018934 [Tachysurus vachellii]